jgi:siroheme synthase (precorrin-2 oxidase/ferrochelatase)
VRPIGGGRYATRRIRQCVEGGDHTRVVADARGG